MMKYYAACTASFNSSQPFATIEGVSTSERGACAKALKNTRRNGDWYDYGTVYECTQKVYDFVRNHGGKAQYGSGNFIMDEETESIMFLNEKKKEKFAPVKSAGSSITPSSSDIPDFDEDYEIDEETGMPKKKTPQGTGVGYGGIVGERIKTENDEEKDEDDDDDDDFSSSISRFSRMRDLQRRRALGLMAHQTRAKTVRKSSVKRNVSTKRKTNTQAPVRKSISRKSSQSKPAKKNNISYLEFSVRNMF